MTYGQFIEELENLKSKVKDLIERTNSDENPEFRAWRHEITDLILTIRGQGYPVNSAIGNMEFTSVYSAYESKEIRIAYYKQALKDSLNEINTILKNYKKYGVPPVVNEEPELELPYPNKVTWYWLKSLFPMNLWFKAGAILITVFLIGLGVGQSKVYKQLFLSSVEIEAHDANKAILPNITN